MIILPTFEGWTVDESQREFRRVEQDEEEIVEFNSKRGQYLLESYQDSWERKTYGY